MIRILAIQLVTAFLLALAYATASPVGAQDTTVGDCSLGAAEAMLDVGDVRARILNNGSQFWVRDNPGIRYEVPKGSGLQSIYAMNLLIGGLVDDELRTAGSTYGPYEFWPGPVPEDGSPPTDCVRFDRIYEVRGIGGDITGPVDGIIGDVTDWPVDQGAPFVDVGGTLDRYDPDEGDYPAMLGDQMLWWIMNDLGNVHERSDTAPLGLEVRGSVFAFDQPGALGRATFYRYQLRNRLDRPVRAAYVGLYQDVDLGAAWDDYMGSDSTTGTAYFYNCDDLDDGNYGEAPPAVGFTVLKRPTSSIEITSEDCSYTDRKSAGFTSNLQSSSGSIMGDPFTAEHFYNFLRGLWKNGQPMTIGGDGKDFSEKPSRFMFPGDPVAGTFWSEVNADGEGGAMPPADRRSIAGVGPFCLGPGDETEVVFAIVWARGRTNLDSVAKLRVVAAGMQEIADTILEPRRLRSDDSDPTHASHDRLGVSDPWPNPASGEVAVRIDLPEPELVRISLVDMTGREVRVLHDQERGVGQYIIRMSITDVPPGLYMLRTRIGHATGARPIIVTR